MKKRMLFIPVLIFLLGLTGCSVVLSPDVYGPPYYTGPAYIYRAPITIIREPIVVPPYSPPPVYPYYWRGYPYYPYYPYYYDYYYHRHR